MRSYAWAYHHEILNGVITNLQRAMLSGGATERDDCSDLLPQASWLATFLANSHDHKYRQKALLFAALAKRMYGSDHAVDAMCYTIFERVGALPAAMHLPEIVGPHQEYIGPQLGPLTDEFLAAYSAAYTKLGDGRVLTAFQAKTVAALQENKYGVLSAPTSAGKSFIVHEYVKSHIREGGAFSALFIVPTKALISQTCAIYRRMRAAEDVDLAIYSSVPDNLELRDIPVVLALTQERCVRLLNTPICHSLSLVFADEIQNLEKGDRGALLEYILHELRARASNARMFAAGPFIGNGPSLGHSLFGVDCPSVETEESPVSQMIIQATPVRLESRLQIRVIQPSSQEHDFMFELATDRVMYSRWRSSPSDAICDALDLFGSNGSSIVYAKGPGTAQLFARRFSEALPGRDVPEETQELIVYLRDSIHPQCSLIQCLQRGIAYHHGGLPDFVRDEIEELFSQHELNVLFCTSTLLEGVNLPADKIFIVAPDKAGEALSPFEFRNLTGRAGRLDQHLCGMVYCINRPRDDGVNPFEVFREECRKDVVSSIDDNLSRSYEQIKTIVAEGTPLLPDSNRELRGVVTVLRARYLRGRDHVFTYLSEKQLTNEQKDSLMSALDGSMPLLSIPPAVAMQNPYVDPILQDRLYGDVLAQPDKWAIRRERGFAADFERVFKQLDDVFQIIAEIAPRGRPEYYRNDLLTFAKLWVRGRVFREIVTRALPGKLRNSYDVSTSDVDKAIKKAMDLITRDISFVTAKYFSVLADIVTEVVPEDELNDYGMTLSLPAMLELGCSDGKTLAMVTACIPRGAAIKLAKLIPDGVEDPVLWLGLHQDDTRFSRLPSIYRKILRRCGIWR